MKQAVNSLLGCTGADTDNADEPIVCLLFLALAACKN
jgi:hypothetical protein